MKKYKLIKVEIDFSNYIILTESFASRSFHSHINPNYQSSSGYLIICSNNNRYIADDYYEIPTWFYVEVEELEFIDNASAILWFKMNY